YLSIAVLLAHIVLALGHIVYVLRAHQSSGSWATITELLILAYNSRPISAALHNMSAGIKCMKAYRKVVIVRATNNTVPTESELNGNHKRVELFFSADDGVKEDSVNADPVERNGGRAVTWPLMPSQEMSNIELIENRSYPSSTAISLTSRDPRSKSKNSDTTRLLDGSDEQQRIELDQFNS
ncbi:hypothetical protein F4821DRAFT_274298, partial [Hypoxylon rubiginosum]